MTAKADEFPRTTAGLPAARPTEVVDLADGDRVELRIAPVVKRVGDAEVRMLAYDGSVPGPTLRVPQGSEVEVEVVNEGDLETTVHWHGLRLDNRADGTHETQAPIPVGGRFTTRVAFPDPGAYWYHPHVREDYGQELGLYGNVLVEPADPEYWGPAHRELLLTLDDLLLEDGRVAPFHRTETTHAAMGRYGDVLLVAGETDLALRARRDEVVRLFLTNTANTRVFKVALPGARLKLVGGDSGRCEHEELVEEVVIAPSERVVLDVLFATPGRLTLEHRTPGRTWALASVDVAEERAEPGPAEAFGGLRRDPELAAERERLGPVLEAEPDEVVAFVAEMDVAVPEGPVVFACPMHPDVVQDEAGRCPRCGMALLPRSADAPASGHEDHEHHGHEHHGHEHHGHEHHEHGHGHEHHHAHTTADGIEWEDDMAEVNRATTAATMRWSIVDAETREAPRWRFNVGDRVKVRLVNEMDSDHPMHHPFHVHGAGRFLVLARDGVAEPNLVWKDTVLVRTGETVDLLLEVTNPGVWMAHCHIAEHHESGMMFSFDVAPAA
jgi:FtsP/CotA-like multicopper oxidase with cupredoxin domain